MIPSNSFPSLKSTAVSYDANGEIFATSSATEELIHHFQKNWHRNGHARILADTMQEIINSRKDEPITKIVVLAIGNIHGADNTDRAMTTERFMNLHFRRRADDRPAEVEFLAMQPRSSDNAQVNQFVVLSQIAAHLSIANPEVLTKMFAQDPVMTSETRQAFEARGFQFVEDPEAWDMIDSNTLVYAPFLDFTLVLTRMRYKSPDVGVLIGNDYLNAVKNYSKRLPNEPHLPAWMEATAAALLDKSVCYYKGYFPLYEPSQWEVSEIADYWYKILPMTIYWRPKPARGTASEIQQPAVREPFSEGWKQWQKNIMSYWTFT